MRWQGQSISAFDENALPGLNRIAGLMRTVTTPEFAGITFHEVHAKSALNKVPGASAMPFKWTINPMRGCVHRCRYCFARKTHEYLDFDSGADFDSQIVVKVNVAEVLRRELARPSWIHERVAIGSNTDPYQRPEGRYKLMPGIINALADSGTPFSILTKGPLLRRDLPLLQKARASVPIGIAVSLALIDPDLQQAVEPGTPLPQARLDLIKAVRDAGLPCGVFVAPVLPGLSDSAEQLEKLISALSDAGASSVSVLALHLRPGAREWFLKWLTATHPELVQRYQRLYARGAYVTEEYKQWLWQQVSPLLQQYGFGTHRQVGGQYGETGKLSLEEARDFPGDSFPSDLAPSVTYEPSLF